MKVFASIENAWPVKRLKFCASYNDDVLPESTDEFHSIQYVEISDVSLVGGIEKSTPALFHEAPSRARRKVKVGDIIVSTVRTYLKAIAAVGKESDNFVVSTGFCVIRPSKDFDAGYLSWVIKSEKFISDIVSRSVGVSYPAINSSQLVDIEVPLPPLKIQRRITSFLDQQITKVDAVVEKKRALLDQLADKRQATITQAVTKGLNPTIPMKDSGVESIEQIPAHWQVKRLKFFTSRPLKYGANAAADWDEQAWPRFVRITDVATDGSLRPETFRSLPPEIAQEYLLADGDILLARSGATVGKSFIYRPEWGMACFAGYLIQCRISAEYEAEFVHKFLVSDVFWSWVSANFIQSTIQNISAEKYASLYVTCPPKQEQKEIASYLENVLSRLARQMRLISQSVAQLNEYRSALITAAITGQIEGLR